VDVSRWIRRGCKSLGPQGHGIVLYVVLVVRVVIAAKKLGQKVNTSYSMSNGACDV